MHIVLPKMRPELDPDEQQRSLNRRGPAGGFSTSAAATRRSPDWPLPDSEFDFINCQDVTEHLDNINRVMEVIHRSRANPCRGLLSRSRRSFLVPACREAIEPARSLGQPLAEGLAERLELLRATGACGSCAPVR